MDTAVKPQGCTNLKLRQLMRRVAQHYDAEVGKTGLKGTQYSLLSYVVKLGPIRPGDLAREMKIGPSTLTRNLRPLIDAGWVTLGPGPDGRSRLIQATDAGRDPKTLGLGVFNAKTDPANLAELQALGTEFVALGLPPLDRDAALKAMDAYAPLVAEFNA